MIPTGWFVAESDNTATLMALDREPPQTFIIQNPDDYGIGTLGRYAYLFNRFEKTFGVKLTAQEVADGPQASSPAGTE